MSAAESPALWYQLALHPVVQFPAVPPVHAAQVAGVKVPPVDAHEAVPDTVYPALHVGWHVEPAAMAFVQSPLVPQVGAALPSHNVFVTACVAKLAATPPPAVVGMFAAVLSFAYVRVNVAVAAVMAAVVKSTLGSLPVTVQALMAHPSLRVNCAWAHAEA